jgi:hypothetical protein
MTRRGHTKTRSTIHLPGNDPLDSNLRIVIEQKRTTERSGTERYGTANMKPSEAFASWKRQRARTLVKDPRPTEPARHGEHTRQVNPDWLGWWLTEQAIDRPLSTGRYPDGLREMLAAGARSWDWERTFGLGSTPALTWALGVEPDLWARAEEGRVMQRLKGICEQAGDDLLTELLEEFAPQVKETA